MSIPTPTRHTPPEKDAILRLQTAIELMHHSVMNIVTIAGEMQELATQLPEHPAKAQMITMISQLYQHCGFEDLASQHITQAVLLWNDMENHNSLLNGPSLTNGHGLSQNEIDDLLGGTK